MKQTMPHSHKLSEQPMDYYVEVTDTFGGEPNFAWVNRFSVSARTPRGAMRKVSKRIGGKVRKDYGDGETENWVWRDRPIIAFVYPLDIYIPQEGVSTDAENIDAGSYLQRLQLERL